MPKEIRKRIDDACEAESRFWQWEDAGAPLVLRGEAGEKCRDLMERSARFGEAVLRFVKKVPRGSTNPENTRLVSQVVGAATSIGANYCEADDCVSGKDFRKSIGTCRKESKETMFFLRTIAATLWREAKELNLIFGAIWRMAE